MLPTPDLSVVLPCYNPPAGWLDKVKENITAIINAYPGKSIEFIIVNDGSTKNFNAIDVRQQLSAYKACIIDDTTNHGKGYAVRLGTAAAQGRLTIYTDIDFPYTQNSFDAIYTALLAGNDLAIGIRSSSYYTHLPKTRVCISKFLKMLIRMFLRIPTSDTQCGLKGFNETGKEVFYATTIDRYLFDLEFIFLAAREKLSIKTVEVELRDDVQLSSMNWRVLSHEFGNFMKVFFKSISGKG